MKVKIIQTVMALSIGAMLLMNGVGCGTEDYSLLIMGTLIPDEKCEYSVPKEDDFFRTRGILDVSFLRDFGSQRYSMGMAITNRSFNSELYLGQSTNAVQKGMYINTNDIKMKEIRVKIDLAQGSEYSTPIPEFRMDHGGTIIYSRKQAAASIVNLISLSSEIIPPYIIEIMATDPAVSSIGDQADALVTIKIVGETLDGKEVMSNEYQYPITICYGCLNAFPGLSVQNCPIGSEISQGLGDDVGICLPGQDGVPGRSVLSCECPGQLVIDPITNECIDKS